MYNRQPGKTDEVFDILLNSMDFESKLPQKRVSSYCHPGLHNIYGLQAYSASVVGYIELLGIHCARHLKVCVVCVCMVRVHASYSAVYAYTTPWPS